jgi:hypothetical protein
VAIALALGALAACDRQGSGKAAAPPPAPVSTAPVAAPPWFICDALNGPTVLVFSRPDATNQVRVLTIDKSDLHPPSATLYALGASDGAAGSVFRALSRDGVEVGHVRTLNPGVLPDPAAATTPPVTSVKIDETDLSCRWLARTRLFGLAAGRTVLVTEEGDGPVYRTFDFKDAQTAQPVNPDGAQRSTTPSLEVRAGRRDGERYTFSHGAFTYAVGPTGVSAGDGGQMTASEPFVALQRPE